MVYHVTIHVTQPEWEILEANLADGPDGVMKSLTVADVTFDFDFIVVNEEGRYVLINTILDARYELVLQPLPAEQKITTAKPQTKVDDNTNSVNKLTEREIASQVVAWKWIQNYQAPENKGFQCDFLIEFLKIIMDSPPAWTNSDPWFEFLINIRDSSVLSQILHQELSNADFSTSNVDRIKLLNFAMGKAYQKVLGFIYP